MATTKRSTNRPPVETLVAGDPDLMKALMKDALQEVLEAEMTELLGASPNERTQTRNGYRAGYYGRGLVTRIGKLALRVPRDRHGEFSTALFARYARSEKALVAALAEMYVQGAYRPARSRRLRKNCTVTASRPRRSTRGWTRRWRSSHTGRWRKRIRT
jgi:transposase-like protein